LLENSPSVALGLELVPNQVSCWLAADVESTLLLRRLTR
jgi:hypothetical protein